MAIKPVIMIAFLVSSAWGAQWAVNNPEQWMDEEKIAAYQKFNEMKNIQSITIQGQDYRIENGDIDLIKLYDMARAEANRIIASGDTENYKTQLREYNAFFRMIGADEIPL